MPWREDTHTSLHDMDQNARCTLFQVRIQDFGQGRGPVPVPIRTFVSVKAAISMSHLNSEDSASGEGGLWDAGQWKESPHTGSAVVRGLQPHQ